MIHKKKKLIKYTPLLLALLSSSVINYAYAAWLNSKDTTTMTEVKPDYWTYDYAIELMERSANISYGIQDRLLFEEILTQKDKGDPNALFVYAYLLRNYNVVNERVGLSREGANMTGFNIYWDLSEQGHPQACDELLQIGQKDALKFRDITAEELLEKQKQCATIALENGLTNFSTYANTFIFGVEKDNAYKLFLTDSHNLSNKKEVAYGVKIYEQGAQSNGCEDCIGRMAEVYYEGIGKDKDEELAAAWAKLVSERTRPTNIFRAVKIAHELNKKFEQNEEIQNSARYKQLSLELQKNIPFYQY